MGLFDFFKRAPSEIEDERFGTLRLDRSGYWTGEADFPPLGRRVEIMLAGTPNQPNQSALAAWDDIVERFDDLRELATDDLVEARRRIAAGEDPELRADEDAEQGANEGEEQPTPEEAAEAATAAPVRATSDEETDALWSAVRECSITLYSPGRFTLALGFDWPDEAQVDDDTEIHVDVTEWVLIGVLVG